MAGKIRRPERTVAVNRGQDAQLRRRQPRAGIDAPQQTPQAQQSDPQTGRFIEVGGITARIAGRATPSWHLWTTHRVTIHACCEATIRRYQLR